MEIYQRINEIIEEQNLTKRAFAERLISLEPKLNSTNEIPSEKTIYKYLNGSLSLRLELIPYIAEALGVVEQELFLTSTKDRLKFYRKIVQNANDKELEIIKNKLESIYKLDMVLESYSHSTSIDKSTNSKKEQLIALLDHMPEPLLDSLLIKLNEIMKYTGNLSKF